MEVYVGMDVHRKRSQVAVLDARGTSCSTATSPTTQPSWWPCWVG